LLKPATHQPARAGGSVSSPAEFPFLISRQERAGPLGQLYGGCLHQQAGRISLPHSVGQNLRDVVLVLPTLNLTSCQTPDRQPQCSSRRAQQVFQGHSLRMDINSPCPSASLDRDLQPIIDLFATRFSKRLQILSHLFQIRRLGK